MFSTHYSIILYSTPTRSCQVFTLPAVSLSHWYAAWHPSPATCWAPAGAAGRAMVTLTSLLTSSPLHVLLVEVFTRYLKDYGEWPAISRVCFLCVGLG